MYPFVNKYREYPVGHPDIITENFKEMSADQKEDDRYFGKIKGEFLPPDNLIHPVLPWRSPGGKLCFTLCRTCCEKNQVSECRHSQEERSLSGTYASVEVYAALERGYKLLKLHEVWHYEKRSTDLFKS